jgi:methionyl-tRNA formyltransferase
MAAQCAKIIAEHDALVLPVIVHHRSAHQWSSQIQKLSNQLDIPHVTVENINDAEAVGIVNDAHPDIIFSVNNWDVIRADLLAIPADGIINFHNGPLPRYRGVNAPSWAIINREHDYGVTWHYVAESVDTGDIVATRSFSLRPDETAVSLMFRCMETGVELLPSLLDRYASGRMEAWPQKGEPHYYSAKDSPNRGYLDFNQTFDRLSALVRGLSFRPFENQFTYPKIPAVNRTLLVTELSHVCDRPEHESWTCGEVRTIDDRGIVVCARDCQVRLSGLMQENLTDIGDAGEVESFGLKVGSVLRSNDG